MNTYCADLHIHSVLSPCGDLELSPLNIVEMAAKKGLDIIAVTDHNHTGHAKLTRELGVKRGVWVVYGVELCTREDVHCLAFFDNNEQVDIFQGLLDQNLPQIPNDASKLGYQVIVDEKENILEEITHSLYPGLAWDIEEAAKFVQDLGGLFVPAHVDRPMNGLYAQLGIWPEGFIADGVEISRRTNKEAFLSAHPELEAYTILCNSDAHYLADIGRSYNRIIMKSRDFQEFRLAMRGKDGRRFVA